MAANLTGMFNQLNQAVLSNPMAGQQGKDLVASLSQNLGNVASGATGLLTNGQNRADPYSFMTPQAKMMQGQKDMANVKNMSSIEGLRKAATIQQKMGNTKAAVTLSAQADQKEAEMKEAAESKQRALNAKRGALLSSMGEEATAKAESNRERAKKAIAVSRAEANKDYEAAEQIKAGFLSPEEYMEKQLNPKEEEERFKYEKLDDGDTLVRIDTKTGNTDVVSENKKESPEGTKGPLSVKMQGELVKVDDALQEVNLSDAKIDRLLEDINDVDYDAGIVQSAGTWMRTITGYRNESDVIRQQIKAIINNAALQNLPPGVASDADVKLVLAGEVPIMAGKQEIIRYANGIKKLNKVIRDYNLAKSTHITRNGSTAGFAMSQENKNMRATLARVPVSEIEEMQKLLLNASTPKEEQAADLAFQNEFGFSYLDTTRRLNENMSILKDEGIKE